MTGKGSFKTAPIGAAAAFSSWCTATPRTRHDVHRAVIQSILKYAHPDFEMQTGGDLVENANDTSLWPIFFDAERDLLRKTAYFPALGNHERNAQDYYDFMYAKPGFYYSFDWGAAAHFAVIDSDIGNVSSFKVGKGRVLAGANAVAGERSRRRAGGRPAFRICASSANDRRHTASGRQSADDGARASLRKIPCVSRILRS